MLHCPCKSYKLKRIVRDDIPTRSEIQRCLGTSLAQIFFDYSHHETIKLLDMAPALQQAYSTKHDYQIDTNALQKWSEKQDILKSCIHRDILVLGEEMLKKFQVEVEILTKNVMMDKFEEERHMHEAEQRFIIRRNAEEIHSKYEEYFKAVQQELQEKLDAEWEELKHKHNKELQRAVVKTRLDTTRDVLQKIRSVINSTITFLNIEFEQSHRAQREKLIADFNKIMRKRYIELNAKIKEVERKKTEELNIQRRELETRNAENIIYILCMERLRNDVRIHAVHKHFEEKIKLLHELIAKQDETVRRMKNKIVNYSGKNTALREKILAVTKEFQKFINLAFNALPEHADFLLPPELCLIDDNAEDKDDVKSDDSHSLTTAIPVWISLQIVCLAMIKLC